MKIRTLVLAALLTALAMPALAAIKVYNATPPNGTGGDQLQYSADFCPPIVVTPGTIQGHYTLSDTGGGTTTMVDFQQYPVTFVDFGPDVLTSIFGPGSFVFVNSTPTVTIESLPITRSGSTAPSTGSIAWGLISGWNNTGVAFCIASPQTICTGGTMVPHGITTPLDPINSPTYDLGTWTFDAEGDMTAASNYIEQTNNGGTSNRQRLLRGAYVGAAIPALPLVGAGALALGLLIAGTRSVMRKK
jgi:hypothetical protein